MSFTKLEIVAIIVSAALAVALTPLIRALARRIGFVAKPKTDRWHKKPTAMLGGIAIVLSVAAAWLLFPSAIGQRGQGFVVLGASVFLGLVGLIDDVYHIKPYQKLIGQLIGAAAVV